MAISRSVTKLGFTTVFIGEYTCEEKGAWGRVGTRGQTALSGLPGRSFFAVKIDQS